MAHPYGGNHGAAAISTYGGIVNNLDGTSAFFGIQNLNVPTTCGPRTTPAAGCTVTNGNARPMQMGATAPQSAVITGEFVGYGYGAGCAAPPVGCAGTGGGSFSEKIYYDGRNQYGNYIGQFVDGVAVGTNPSLAIVRYGTYWTLHLNGTHRWNIITMSMSQGTSSLGSESTGGQTLLMDQLWSGWGQKQVGGTTIDVGQVSEIEPHSPACYVSNFAPSTGYGTILEVDGSC